MTEKKKGNFLGLTPIILFLGLVLFGGGSEIGSMPVLVAFILSAGYALLLNPKDRKMSIGEKVDLFCTGGGEKTIILLVVIFLLAGAFYSTTIDIGARDATVNFGLQFIPSRMLVPGLFIISCFISFAMGTSMGTVTAISPIGIGLAERIGIPIPIALGIVVGGAMFGDNLSFISDTTIAATRTQGVTLRDKFKVNLLVVLPAAVITCVILMFVKFDASSAVDTGSYNFWLILPYLLIIVAALAGLNVISVLAIGVGASCIIGLSFGLFTIQTMWASLHKGMMWMQDLAVIALVIGGIVELMKAYGGIDWLLTNLTSKVKTKKGAEFSIAALVSVLNFATANNTVSIVSAGPIARELNDEYQVDPRRTAGLLDVFSCCVQGIVPYGGQILAAAALGGVSPISVVPYCWYPMLIGVCGVLAIVFGVPRLKGEAVDDYGNPALRRKVRQCE